jgi:transposase
MGRKLTTQERANLIIQHKKERDKRVCDRIKAVLAYDDGYTYSEISRLLLLDDETIRRHVEAYFSIHKLKPENGGSTSYLNVYETERLKAHLHENTYLYVKDICAYVRKTFNKSYSISGMTKWLIANHFRYKNPHGVPAKADSERQKLFVEYYQSLKAGLQKNEVIYFADSTHPQHQTRLAYGWIAKGVRKAEKMTACQKRINLIGAINLDGHQIESLQVEWVNSETIKLFLTQLIASNPNTEKIHLFLDNARYNKSKDIQDFVKNKKIVLHYLPPYSPNLNPIERLWKVMHENVTYNRYYSKFADFTEGILNFFSNLQQMMPIIQARINDNFQKLNPAYTQ